MAPMIQDLVEDRTRLRALTVGIALLMYTVLAYDILIFMPVDSDETVAKIVFSSTVPHAAYLGEALFHSPGVEVLTATEGSLPGREVSVRIDNVFMGDTSGTIDCSTAAQDSIRGTAKGLRLAGVCDTVLAGSSNRTDDLGDVRFSELRFSNGPPGMYMLTFDTTSSDAVNSPLSASVRVLSSVLHLEPLNSIPSDIVIGETFPEYAQPQVRVLSDEWLPLSGRTVTAFSWPWPEFKMTKAAEHHSFGQQLALLEGAQTISDAGGIARFTNLRITAASQPYTYIMLHCEGTVVSWNAEAITGSRMIDEAPAAAAYVAPILIAADASYSKLAVLVQNGTSLRSAIASLDAEGHDCLDSAAAAAGTGTADSSSSSSSSSSNSSSSCEVQFVQHASSGNVSAGICQDGCLYSQPFVVLEGDTVPTEALQVSVVRPPTCTGTNAVTRPACEANFVHGERTSCGQSCIYVDSRPVAGVRVIAMIASANDYFYPSYFQFGRAVANHKELINPVSSLTDAAGVARFPDLRFSISGQVGFYRLGFAASGYVSAAISRSFLVQSRVAKVVVVNRGGVRLELQHGTPSHQLPGISQSVLRHPDTLTVVAYDIGGEPLPGKRLDKVYLIDATDTLIQGAMLVVDVEAAVAQGVPLETGTDGTVTVPVKYSVLPSGVGDPECRFGCVVAGFRATIDGVNSVLGLHDGTPTAVAVAPRCIGNCAARCQRLEVHGLNGGKKVQADLRDVDFANVSTIVKSRCLALPNGTFSARNPSNFALPLCRQTGESTDCFRITITAVESFEESAARPGEAPWYDETYAGFEDQLCFSGVAGTVVFKFEATWLGVNGTELGCSSDLIHVAWYGQTSFVSLDAADPRAGDLFFDYREYTFTPGYTHPMYSEFQLNQASMKVWKPIEELHHAHPNEYFSHLESQLFIGFEMRFYDSGFSEVFPGSISETTSISLVGTAPNTLPIWSTPEKYVRTIAGTPSFDSTVDADTRIAFVFEHGAIEFRRLRVDAESSNVSLPCGQSICYRHFMAIMVREGFAGELAIVVESEGAMSPVMRLSVKSPVASIEIKQQAQVGVLGGKLGEPLSVSPEVILRDQAGKALRGFAVLATLTPDDDYDEHDDDGWTSDSPTSDKLEEAFELSADGTQKLNRSSASFGLPLGSSLDFTMVKYDTTECTEIYDAAMGISSENNGRPCNPALSNSSRVPSNPACQPRERCSAEGSCKSDSDGVAKFPPLIPYLAAQGSNCYRPRYMYVPYRSTERPQYQWIDANGPVDIGVNVYSVFGELLCFHNQDKFTILVEPSATILEGESGFMVPPTVRVTRPYQPVALDPHPPNGQFSMIVAVPVKVENSAKTLAVPPAALNRFTKKKLKHSACIVYGGEGVVGGCSLRPSSFEGMDSVSTRLGETLHMHEIQVQPSLRQAAPGERFSLRFCDGSVMFSPGTAVCTEATQTIVVVNEPTNVISLNGPPAFVHINDVVSMRVMVTANGAPIHLTEVTAKIVHDRGPAKSPSEFLMDAFLQVDGDDACLSLDQAHAVFEQAIKLDLDDVSYIDTLLPEQRRRLETMGCSPLHCDLCDNEAACTGVVSGACEWNSTVCLMSYANDDIITKLKSRMISQLSLLADVNEADAAQCLKSAARSYLSGTKAQLDRGRTRMLTNKDGVASFSLKLSTGLTGNYAVEFRAGDATIKTSSFTVINPVASVDILSFGGIPSSDCNGWRLVEDTSAPNCGNKKQFPLTVELPAITVKAMDFDGHHVEGPDQAIRLSVEEKDGVKQLTFEQIIESTKTMDSEESPIDGLTNLVNLLVQGAKLLQPPSKRASTANGYLVMGKGSGTRSVFDKASGSYTFTGVRLVAAKPGEFLIKASFFGVDSRPSAQSVVVDMIDTSNWQYQVMLWMQRFFVFMLVAAVFLGNNAFDKRELDPVVGVAIAVMIAVVFWLNAQHQQQEWTVEYYLLISVNLVVILVGFLAVIAWSHPSADPAKSQQHVDRRKRAFYRYVTRMFSGDISWYHGQLQMELLNQALEVSRRKKQISIASLNTATQGGAIDSYELHEDLQQNIELYAEVESRILSHINVVPSAGGLPKAENPADTSKSLHKQSSQKGRGISATAVAKFVTEAVDQVSFARKEFQLASQRNADPSIIVENFCSELASITDMKGVPAFLCDLRQPRVVDLFAEARTRALSRRTSNVRQLTDMFRVGDDDAFFFPARILISFSICTVTIVLLMIKATKGIHEFIGNLNSLQDKSLVTIFHFLSQVERQYQVQYAAELDDSAIEYAYAQAASLQKLFAELMDALKLAFVLSMCVTSMMFLWTQAQIFLNLRSQVLLARLGVPTQATKQRHKLKGFDAINFVGVSVANNILAIQLVSTIFWWLFLPFCWPLVARLLWQFVTNNVGVLLAILVPILIRTGSKKYALAYSYSGKNPHNGHTSRMVTHRKCFGCYDTWTLFLGMVTGFGSALVRIILWIVIGLVSLLGITDSPMPGWFERYTQLDTGSKAYQAMVLQTIYHNNPITNVFVWELVRLVRERNDNVNNARPNAQDSQDSNCPTSANSSSRGGDVPRSLLPLLPGQTTPSSSVSDGTRMADGGKNLDDAAVKQHVQHRRRRTIRNRFWVAYMMMRYARIRSERKPTARLTSFPEVVGSH